MKSCVKSNFFPQKIYNLIISTSPINSSRVAWHWRFAEGEERKRMKNTLPRIRTNEVSTPPVAIYTVQPDQLCQNSFNEQYIVDIEIVKYWLVLGICINSEYFLLLLLVLHFHNCESYLAFFLQKLFPSRYLKIVLPGFIVNRDNVHNINK